MLADLLQIPPYCRVPMVMANLGNFQGWKSLNLPFEYMNIPFLLSLKGIVNPKMMYDLLSSVDLKICIFFPHTMKSPWVQIQILCFGSYEKTSYNIFYVQLKKISYTGLEPLEGK